MLHRIPEFFCDGVLIAMWMLHKLPDHLSGLALLVGFYALLRIVLWYIFTRHLTKNVDERGVYECDNDCLKGGRCVTKDQKVPVPKV